VPLSVPPLLAELLREVPVTNPVTGTFAYHLTHVLLFDTITHMNTLEKN